MRTVRLLPLFLLPLASLLSLAHCGGPVGMAAPAPAPVASAAPAPPAPPAERVSFDLSLHGAPVGTESWSVTHPEGGAATEVAFEATLEEAGAKLKGSGVLRLGADSAVKGADLLLETPDGPVKGVLAGAGPAMALTLSRGAESRDVKAEQPSNVFVPQPFFVGFARVCPMLEAGTPALVEFPGVPVGVVGKTPLAGGAATVYTLERGGAGRTVVACDKGELVAALDPVTGQGAVRTGPGGKALLEAVEASVTRQKPKTPDGLVEEDVTVLVPATPKDAEAKLACSFLRPAPTPTSPTSPTTRSPKAKLPAVLFMTGSGPQDRDEDTVGPGGVKLSVFKTMALALADRGIASMRCDDRGTGKSTGTFEAATFSTFARDAEETLKALRQRPDVDPARVGLIGHSEGGMLVPVVARADAKLKAVLFMAAPGRSLPEIAVLQQRQLLEKAGLPKDQVERQLAAQDEVLKAIQKGDPLPAIVPPQERAHIESQRPWLQSHFQHDPQLALRQMPKVDVFIAQGDSDAQVPKEEAELVKKGLADGKNAGDRVKLVLYPRLNHLFAETHGGSLSEYSDPRAHIDATFLSDVVAFFARSFSLPKK